MRNALRIGCLLLVLVCGCADRKPARIEFQPPPSPVVDRRMTPLAATVANKDGTALDHVALSFTARPADVVEVSTDGTYRCLKTGDGEIAATAEGVSVTIPIRCRIPTEIAMPASLRVVLGAPPKKVQGKAHGEGGRPLEDVPVPIVSSDPAVVRIDAAGVSAVAVGRTTLRASLGEVLAVTPVEAVEVIADGPVALEDGASRSWTLAAGTYEVTIDVKPAVRTMQGVTVSWEGASCPAKLEAQTHRLTCTVLERAVLTVKNPATLGLGARVSGTLQIYRVPPS